MDNNKNRMLWLKGAAICFAAGLVFSYMHSSSSPDGGLDTSVYVILAFGAGWLGAAAGGVVEWLRYGRSPLAPFFRARFGWHYRQRYWRRFALVFAVGWLVFVCLSVAVALAVGASEEAGMFFTPEGALAVALFVVVFGLEGAIVGGIVDLFGLLAGKNASGHPERVKR